MATSTLEDDLWQETRAAVAEAPTLALLRDRLSDVYARGAASGVRAAGIEAARMLNFLERKNPSVFDPSNPPDWPGIKRELREGLGRLAATDPEAVEYLKLLAE